jgi:signal peptidase II
LSSHSNSDSLFSLILVENDGAAFNLFSGYGYWLIFFAGAIILWIIIYLLSYKLFIKESFLVKLSFFSAGILGNAIERCIYGHVVDFIKINLFDFPVFNLYDIMITIGAITIAFVIANDKLQEYQDIKDAEEDDLYRKL